MSWADYVWARAQIGDRPDNELERQTLAGARGDPPFYGVIMLAIMRADTMNASKLRSQWPLIWIECQARYDAPGAVLESDPAGLRRYVLGDDAGRPEA